eukprot:gene18193-24634_t
MATLSCDPPPGASSTERAGHVHRPPLNVVMDSQFVGQDNEAPLSGSTSSLKGHVPKPAYPDTIPMFTPPPKSSPAASSPPDSGKGDMDWKEMLRLAKQQHERDQRLSVGGASMLTDNFTGDVAPGVTKIRLTGGEPTVRRDIIDLCGSLSALPGLESLAITTNGITLHRQLAQLKAAGLTAVNISLDSLQESKFEILTRRKGLSHVKRSIDAAVELGYDPVKINVVDRPLNVRFIEYMPFDGNVWSDSKMGRESSTFARIKYMPFEFVVSRIKYMPFEFVVSRIKYMPFEFVVSRIKYMPFEFVVSRIKYMPFEFVVSRIKYMPFEFLEFVVNYKEMTDRIQEAWPDSPLERIADPKVEVAKNFRLPGYRGQVESSCRRKSEDGSLKVCLFGANEVSLRDALRGGASDDDLRLIIGAAVQRKHAKHAGMFEIAKTRNRPMITIGG